MVDLTVTGYQQTHWACDARRQFPYAPTLPTVPSTPEAELPAHEGRDRYGLLLAAAGPVLQRADWLQNVNSRYLNLGRA